MRFIDVEGHVDNWQQSRETDSRPEAHNYSVEKNLESKLQEMVVSPRWPEYEGSSHVLRCVPCYLASASLSCPPP